MIVTLDFVKLFQGKMMAKDEEMCSHFYGEPIYCQVNSSNLNEELGSIGYIFSDKTGTLTCNIMDFKNFIVDGKGYGVKPGSKEDTSQDQEKARRPKVENVDFRDEAFYQKIYNGDKRIEYFRYC